MKMIIELGDIDGLVGKFVVCVSNHEQQRDLTEGGNPDFWLEKRISFVSKTVAGKIALNGFAYCHGEFTNEEFVKKFNTGSTSENGTRHFRLLTSKELRWLFEQMNKNNY